MEQGRVTPGHLVAAGAILAATTVLVVVALVVGGTIRVEALPPPPPASVPGGAPAGPTTTGPPDIAPGAARYEVSGDGPAQFIEYAIEGGESDEVAVTLPWRKSTGADYLSLFASRGPGPGTITCRITGFGRVLAEHTGTGPYATCIASALATE